MCFSLRFPKYNSFYPGTTPPYSKLTSKLGQNRYFLQFFGLAGKWRPIQKNDLHHRNQHKKLHRVQTGNGVVGETSL